MSRSPWTIRAGNNIAAGFAGGGQPFDPLAALVFQVQVRHEDADGDPTISLGAKFNNPLNLTDAWGTIHWPGQIGRYLGNFASFDSLENGCAACVMNYRGGSYPGVLAALAASPFDPLALARAIQESPWDADHYGGHLVEEVRQEMAIDLTYVTAQQFADYQANVKQTIEAMKAAYDPLVVAPPPHQHIGTVTVR